MDMKLAKDEKIIKEYTFWQDGLFNSTGDKQYITVTNRRLVRGAWGRGFGGGEVDAAIEVPIENINGIHKETEKSSRFIPAIVLGLALVVVAVILFIQFARIFTEPGGWMPLLGFLGILTVGVFLFMFGLLWERKTALLDIYLKQYLERSAYMYMMDAKIFGMVFKSKNYVRISTRKPTSQFKEMLDEIYAIILDLQVKKANNDRS